MVLNNSMGSRIFRLPFLTHMIRLRSGRVVVMNTQIYSIYYIQTNLICIILLAFVLVAYLREMRGSSEARFYTAEIIEIMLYCLSDMLAAVCKWSSFPGVRLVLLAANAVYVAFPGIMVATWGQYIYLHMKKYGFQKSWFGRFCRVLVLVGAGVTLSSPFTGFAFYLDANNVYHRNPGVFLVPVVSYLYMIYDAIKLLVISRNIDSLEGRREAKTLAVFVVPGITCSFLQMIFYGCSTAQVGFTLGFLMVYLICQQNKISKDELTGLNNRREFENQFDNMTKSADQLLVAMVDADYFKKINDKYGHVEGDNAIKSIAQILSKACGASRDAGNFFLARYGGDEFVLLAKDFRADAQQALIEAIYGELRKVNETNTHPYELNLSIGIASGEISGKKEARELMRQADQKMYQAKKLKKGK